MSAKDVLPSSAFSPTATQVVQTSPPIANLLPIVSTITQLLYSFTSKVSHVALYILSLSLYPLLALVKALLPPLRYILSPLIVFCQILLGLFFVVPYEAVVKFFVVIQPVYVFCGVACITGAVIGLGGRFVASFFNVLIEGPGDQQEGKGEQVGSLEEKEKAKMLS